MQTITTSDVTIVKLGPADAAQAQRLSLQEGWPHRVEDWHLLLDISHGVGAICDGRLVGTALLTPYGEAGATCNMIIVDPAMRGRGLGRRLVEQLLDMAGGRECRLIATEAGLPLYEKLGFVATGSIRQHQGVVKACLGDERLSDATPADFDELVALDQAALGLDRSGLMARLIKEEPFLLLRKEGRLRGFASCRPFGRGHILGPVVACDDMAFKTLLRTALSRHHGKFLRVDLTEGGSTEIAMVEAAGLPRVSGGVAMTRPGASKANPTGAAYVYALAAQALC